MKRTLLRVQTAVLALGTAFAWVTLILDYRRFFASGGEVFRLSGCAVANPVATPCFYGALAFLAALVWAVVIFKSEADAVLRRQYGLQWLLLAGTLFAWGNFFYLVYRFLQPQPAAAAFSCPPGEPAVNPLTAPCFYGAILFLVALAVSASIRKTWRPW